MIEGLRDFLKRLEGRGELIRIRKEVDPRFEVAALIRDIQQRRNQPVLFERVKGSTLPIVSNTCGSYASSSDVRPLFGLGKNVRVDELKIKWPSGRTTMMKTPAIDRILRIEEGRSSPAGAVQRAAHDRIAFLKTGLIVP